MPSSAEIIHQQREFESERGLDTYNTIQFGLLRLYEEVNEAFQAYQNEPPENLMYELIDVVIFAHSLLGRVAENLNIEPEAIDQAVDRKMLANFTKYDLDFFNNGHDTATAIKHARHWHNLSLNDERLANDYY